MRSLRFSCLFAAVLLAGINASAAEMAPDDLKALRLPDVRIVGVVHFDADPARGPVSVAHTVVDGVVGSEIKFQVHLPDAWNGRFFMGGGGGYVGAVTNAAIGMVNAGYASAGTDTGHSGDGISASWALDNLERRLNFGYLAVHRTAETAKAIVRARYGRDSEFNYFAGASRGGGQAMMEAQRFPGDFDGIVAGCPAFDWTGFTAEMVQNVQLNFPDPKDTSKSVVTQDNLALLQRLVLEKCDGIDGVVDGTMEDPRLCDFDLASIPECPDGQAGPDCVTAAQRAAIAAIYAPATAAGKTIHPGQPFGEEAHPAGWFLWITGTDPRFPPTAPSLQFAFGTEFYRNFVFDYPAWDYTAYDFAAWEADTRLAATYMDATSPDMDAFRDRGGKLLAWHGWSDAALPATRTVEYFDEVRARDPRADEYARLYLLPGVLHGAGGSGTDQVDWNSIIVDWVERGTAPQTVVARKLDAAGAVVRTRPLCPYPAKAAYTGSGDVNEVGSFECVGAR